MIVREVDLFTTVADVYDSDIPAALELLAERDIAAVAAGARIPLVRNATALDSQHTKLVSERAKGRADDRRHDAHPERGNRPATRGSARRGDVCSRARPRFIWSGQLCGAQRSVR